MVTERGELVYQTSNAGIYQCDQSEAFTVIFNQEEMTFRLCDLMKFKRKIQGVDIAAMLMADSPDVELFYIPHCDRILALTIYDILELKALFDGAFTMLELNSLIHRQLIRKTF